ncbi:hypothetical protein HQ544_00010 [Candidatus Falkowbacteria bacterium]|nr:hypothetical protein [Candidatus Falkowbacteria bacterium]
MKRFIKNYLAEVMVIIGSGLFVYNIFNFSYKSYNNTKGGLLPKLSDLGSREIGGIAYYYQHHTLLWITVGTMLIVAGILILRNKKQS